MNTKYLTMMLEFNKEMLELKEIGLSDYEIEGFIEYYIDTWINTGDYNDIKH